MRPITGSAAVFAGRQSTFALVSPCPYADSGDAEFWTLLTILWHYVEHPPVEETIILCDNQQVVRLIRSLLSGDAPSRPTMCAAGTWLVVLGDFLCLHPWSPMLRLVWVKAHVGFRGNELADGLAKWAAQAIPPSTPPTFRRSLTHNGTVVVGRAPKSALKSLVPSHEHRDILVSASFDWVRGTSWFGILPFKWS